MVLSGSATTIFAKVVNQPVPLANYLTDDGEIVTLTTSFSHPLLMILLKFVAESCLLLLLACRLGKDPESA